MSESGTRGPNCWQCRFFAVSWDPRLPYACQRMGFKSKVLPAIEVLRTDGQPCHGFAQRQPRPTVPAETLTEASAAGLAAALPPAPPRITSTRSWEA